jgi:hypothetical protein
MGQKRVYLFLIFLLLITFIQISEACDVIKSPSVIGWERRYGAYDILCIFGQINVYDWSHLSVNQNCACGMGYHPCRSSKFGLAKCSEDMCYDYGHNGNCELGLKGYNGQKVKLSWGFRMSS